MTPARRKNAAITTKFVTLGLVPRVSLRRSLDRHEILGTSPRMTSMFDTQKDFKPDTSGPRVRPHAGPRTGSGRA